MCNVAGNELDGKTDFKIANPTKTSEGINNSNNDKQLNE